MLDTEKVAHWIDDDFGSRCSCCGIYTHLDKFDRPMKFRYCSMCGARMLEPHESEIAKTFITKERSNLCSFQN